MNSFLEKFKNIRLSEETLSAIRLLFCKYFLETDSLWIFGSRVDPKKKGGDIDLYIETSIKDHLQALEKKITFLCDLKKTIGDQKIDVVLNIKSLEYDLPIYRVAKLKGVKII